MKRLFFILLPFILAGCACKCKPVSDYCIKANVITISKKDILTDETKRQIYNNDILYETTCLGA